jgi:hypothetical protein
VAKEDYMKPQYAKLKAKALESLELFRVGCSPPDVVLESHCQTIVDLVDEHEQVSSIADDQLHSLGEERRKIHVLQNQIGRLTDCAQDFFDGTEADRGHEPEWKALSEALAEADLRENETTSN